MQISLTAAKAQLTELVRRAETGEEVILTRHGRPAVRLLPIRETIDPRARRKILDEIQRSASVKARVGESAARSQDFLYGEDGMPR